MPATSAQQATQQQERGRPEAEGHPPPLGGPQQVAGSSRRGPAGAAAASARPADGSATATADRGRAVLRTRTGHDRHCPSQGRSRSSAQARNEAPGAKPSVWSASTTLPRPVPGGVGEHQEVVLAEEAPAQQDPCHDQVGGDHEHGDEAAPRAPRGDQRRQPRPRASPRRAPLQLVVRVVQVFQVVPVAPWAVSRSAGLRSSRHITSRPTATAATRSSTSIAPRRSTASATAAAQVASATRPGADEASRPRSQEGADDTAGREADPAEDERADGAPDHAPPRDIRTGPVVATREGASGPSSDARLRRSGARRRRRRRAAAAPGPPPTSRADAVGPVGREVEVGPRRPRRPGPPSPAATRRPARRELLAVEGRLPARVDVLRDPQDRLVTGADLHGAVGRGPGADGDVAGGDRGCRVRLPASSCGASTRRRRREPVVRGDAEVVRPRRRAATGLPQVSRSSASRRRRRRESPTTLVGAPRRRSRAVGPKPQARRSGWSGPGCT